MEKMLQLLACGLLASGIAVAGGELIQIDMFSDAQCPCSAQATSDMKKCVAQVLIACLI